MPEIEIPVGVIGIKVELDFLHHPMTIQFVDSAGFPMGETIRLGEESNVVRAIQEILGTLTPWTDHFVLRYDDGSEFFFIPVNRRPRPS